MAGENVGVYGINQGGLGLLSANYDLSYQGNNLTITKALLIVPVALGMDEDLLLALAVLDAQLVVATAARAAEALEDAAGLSAITLSSALVMVRLLPW